MATLRVRLTLALVGLVLLLGILHVGSTWITTEAYIREVNQKLNLDLAEKIAHETSLIRAGNVDGAALEDLFHSLMVINPSIELYLLDPEGRILAFSAPAGKVQLERSQPNNIVNWFLGGFSMGIIHGKVTYKGQIHEAYGVVELLR